MWRRNTIHAALVTVAGVLLAAAVPAGAQTFPRPDWRRIGNAAQDLALGSAAAGPVSRVWYSPDGSRLYARTSTGRVFYTTDFENWTPAAEPVTVPAATDDSPPPVRPENFVRVRGAGTRMYAIGTYVYKSEDGGRNWANLTRQRDQSLIGSGIADLAVSPKDNDDIAVATATGVWRSADAGLSWSGLNQALPNLPVRRILSLPMGTRGLRIGAGEPMAAFEWAPGEKQSWRPSPDDFLETEAQLEAALTARLGARISAVAALGELIYAGSVDGQLWASSDGGRTWRQNPDRAAAPVERIFIDPRDPRLALVALGSRLADQPATARAPHVLRILNAGAFWDDLTANLPDMAVHGVAADRSTGAVYIATDRGLFVAFEDLVNAAPAANWTQLRDGLPETPAMDVRLDASSNQIYAAFEGYGVYAAPAPHRFREPRVVNGADFSNRAAAPGALLSVLGVRVRSAQAGGTVVPVLAAADTKSEIQIPFEARGTSLALALESAGGVINVPLTLQPTSPAIFIDRDSSPVVLDADSGVMLDAMTPARSNARIQLLAAGLGRVKPEWPTGMPAPVENPPQVVAGVRAYLDRQPVEVTRAVLAPGYVGFYLVEIQLPKLVNYGPAELYIEADGQPSNRVRVYIEP